MPYIADSLPKLTQWRAKFGAPWLIDGSSKAPRVGFVPTMGALHDGHIELVRQAKTKSDVVIVSIFVNPYQFAPTEDFDKYPRTFERDSMLLAKEGVDCIFYPNESAMYPQGRDEIVSVLPPAGLNDSLEGAFRPTFFRGVATVVTKLFTLVQPHQAYFGEKDYQQLQVIKALVRDLNLPVDIQAVPTVRESDGLAMSSRNAYLDKNARQLAPVLNQTLQSVRAAFEAGQDLSNALAAATKKLQDQSTIDLQYLSVCHAETLKPLTQFELPFVVLVAARLGEVRLIDNIVVRQ